MFFSKNDVDFTGCKILHSHNFIKNRHLKQLEILNALFKFALLITAILAGLQLFKKSKKSLFESFLFATIIFSIIDIISNYLFIGYLQSQKMFAAFANINQYVFYLFEIITIILFYKELNGKKKNIRIFLILTALTIIITILLFKSSNIDSSFFTLTLIVIFELLFINFSFSYFLIKNLEIENTTTDSRLVIINYSLFIFINFTTPFYFMHIYLSKLNSEIPDLHFINYIGYIILYSTIIKSLRWKI